MKLREEFSLQRLLYGFFEFRLTLALAVMLTAALVLLYLRLGGTEMAGGFIPEQTGIYSYTNEAK